MASSVHNTDVTADASHDPRQWSDAELMRELGNGDMQSLGVLVERYQEFVRVLAFRLAGRWEVADDIAQDAFLRLRSAASRYQPDKQLPALLRRIVVNLCLDWRRRKRPGAWPAEELPDRGEASVTGELEASERSAAVWAQIAQLPERQRVALVLHRFEGLSHEEIAATTGWSASAVESLLVRAYTQLRERLRPWL